MRWLALPIGLLLLAVIWLGPLLGSWRQAFTAHMLVHMGVVAIASPLIALGLPKRWRAGLSMPTALPVLASLLELIVVWGWHAPAMRAAAEASLTITLAEQGAFLFTGVLLWWSCFAGSGDRLHAGIGAGTLLLTSVHMTLLGALLTLSPRPLYGSGEVTCFGLVLDAGADQQLGGVIMLLIGSAVYLMGGVVLARRLLMDPAASAA